MAPLRLQIDRPLPYFAEIPYYLWGQVNYDSEGDCKNPTDREWTRMYLQHRGTEEVVEIRKDKKSCLVTATVETQARLGLFFVNRCSANPVIKPIRLNLNWDHTAASVRAAKVASEFEQPAFAPFDSHFFWGSWKWIGWFATDCTWVGRWIMHSVVRNDTRAIPLCIDWLKAPPRFPEQEAALCYAVQRLSDESARGGKEWVRWYEGSLFLKGAKVRYPQPDLNVWLAEMKREFGGEN
jgi:hypothetical protein